MCYSDSLFLVPLKIVWHWGLLSPFFLQVKMQNVKCLFFNIRHVKIYIISQQFNFDKNYSKHREEKDVKNVLYTCVVYCTCSIQSISVLMGILYTACVREAVSWVQGFSFFPSRVTSVLYSGQIQNQLVHDYCVLPAMYY